jgi:hypothetical protein
MNWQDIDPKDATEIDCTTRPDLNPPRTQTGNVCPWPWEPQQLTGVPLGQYHCGYCGEMVVAGVPHPDYGNSGDDSGDSFSQTFSQNPDDDSFTGPML